MRKLLVAILFGLVATAGAQPAPPARPAAPARPVRAKGKVDVAKATAALRGADVAAAAKAAAEGYNSELCDRPFGEKKSMPGGFDDSPIRLNAYFKTVNEWNEGHIRNRAMSIAEKAKEIWPSPKLASDVLAKYASAPAVAAAEYSLGSYEFLIRRNAGSLRWAGEENFEHRCFGSHRVQKALHRVQGNDELCRYRPAKVEADSFSQHPV